MMVGTPCRIDGCECFAFARSYWSSYATPESMTPRVAMRCERGHTYIVDVEERELP